MANELEKYRMLISQYLGEMGRDDIDVGLVEEIDQGRLRVEFIKGPMRRDAEVPVYDLKNPEQARSAINIALLQLSKAVAKEHIAEAKEGN
ncbi:MAG TPA: hypothetical protein VFH67_08280 [bacterium]|nr:hypothetical protein [bacterium]